jgi:hypothetical protein
MVALRRLVLVILVLVAPGVLIFLIDKGTYALLAATNRVVDPFYMEASSVFVFAFFTFIAFLEAKSRW